MTDELLRGLATQAANMAKNDLRYKRSFSGLIASYFEGEGLRRMRLVERLIIDKCGRDWLDKDAAKSAAWSVIREAITRMPNLDAFIFASVTNMYYSTEALQALPMEEQLKIARSNRHRDLPQYFKPSEALTVVVQARERVCIFNQAIRGSLFIGEPEVRCCAQDEFEGRLKVFGEPEEKVI